MRKSKPNRAIDLFQGKALASLDGWRDMHSQVTTQKMRQEASLAAFNRVAIAFERFRSDWHIAAINWDATTFNLTQVNRVNGALKQANKSVLADYVNVTVGNKHPRLSLIEDVLQPGGTYTVKSLSHWVAESKKHHVQPWLGKIEAMSKTESELQLCNAVVALRNCIAHESLASKRAVDREVLRMRDPQNVDLLRNSNGLNVSGVARYLNAEQNKVARVDLYHHRLIAFAEALRVLSV